MSTLFSVADPLTHGYENVYRALSELRETFHRSGRLDDSNAKLDEVSKLFATYVAYRAGRIAEFPAADAPDVIEELRAAFTSTVKLPQYQLQDGGSIFGTQPAIALRREDGELARELVSLVRGSVDLAFDLRAAGQPFDILNEAFGHFVRDNFRGNVEDAQYMTPPEVVRFMTEFALHDIRERDPAARDPGKHWTVLDPSCGVGSFLASIYHHANDTDWLGRDRLRLFGQDKVERMVRLSTINLELFDVEEHRVTVGNSLERGSPIDALNGAVDLILTNPPFGARFDPAYVADACGSNTPFFSGLRRGASAIDSELLFIDRNIELLRDDGHLLIVVPDGVVSARGAAAMLRHHLAGVATVRAVIELPAVTFAQAGTRTKTAILYLRKGRGGAASRTTTMGVVKDLGFVVSSRKGVQIKVSEGRNELPRMLDAIRDSHTGGAGDEVHVVRTDPSCVIVPESDVLRGSWTPSHYSASRYQAIAAVEHHSDFDLVALGSIVDFHADQRKATAWCEGCAFISVLHILGEGLVDVAGVMSHAPKTPGVRAYPGEVLVSRINPRIPRVCVTPDFGVKTLCSSEFEVMSPKVMDAHSLAYLLQTQVVQNQIQSLTSGTSSSHNRIRTAELSQVQVPIPKAGTRRARQLSRLVAAYRAAVQSLSDATMKLSRVRTRRDELFAEP